MPLTTRFGSIDYRRFKVSLGKVVRVCKDGHWHIFAAAQWDEVDYFVHELPARGYTDIEPAMSMFSYTWEAHTEITFSTRGDSVEPYPTPCLPEVHTEGLFDHCVRTLRQAKRIVEGHADRNCEAVFYFYRGGYRPIWNSTIGEMLSEDPAALLVAERVGGRWRNLGKTVGNLNWREDLHDALAQVAVEDETDAIARIAMLEDRIPVVERVWPDLKLRFQDSKSFYETWLSKTRAEAEAEYRDQQQSWSDLQETYDFLRANHG